MLFIDVSNNQGAIDWAAVARSGVKGAWLKASEGRTFRDSWFDRHRSQAHAAGLRVGAYHYARPDNNGALSEVANFTAAVGRVERGELRPVLDFEHPAPGLTLSELERWARMFSQGVKGNLGVFPLFYSFSSFITNMLLERPIGGGLWLANYGPNDGQRHSVRVPAPWRKMVAHQYSSRGRVPGVRGDVDVNEILSLNAALAHPVRDRIPPRPRPPVNVSRGAYGDMEGLNRDLLVRLAKVGRDLNKRVHIRSGFRTFAEQTVLWNQYRSCLRRGRGGCILAARPGTSRHESGRAADCDVSGVNIGAFPGARAAMRRHGLCLPVPGEQWHVEPGNVWRA